MPFFSRKLNVNSRSDLALSGAGSQHLAQTQNTNRRFKILLSRLFRSSRHGDTTSQVPAVHDQHMSVDIPRPLNPASIAAEDRNPFLNTAEAIHVAAQLEGAQNYTIGGNSTLTSIGMNTGVNVTTVNNYGGIHGLEILKEIVSFAALHDSAVQDAARRCHPGTRKNVLSRLQSWIDDPNSTDRIAWLHGPAGAGKSAIAQTIARAYEGGEVVATFFFYRSDPNRNDGNRLFPTIAWQLAFSIPAIKSFIVHVLDQIPHLPGKEIETQFKHFVAHPFQPTNNMTLQMPHSAPVVIIDGIDECSDEDLQRRILSVIGNAVKNRLVPLRFLVCSRPESLIEDVLDQFKGTTLRIDLAILDDSNRDIEKYLLDQFSVIKTNRDLNPTWPGPKVIEEFVFKSSGNFIFASTVMRYVGDEDCDPEEQLDIVRNLKPCGKISPFALLDELYLEILKRQRDQDFLKTFLALFIGRSSITHGDLHKGDTLLMNVSDKNLHMKLRRMRSLLKFEPFVDVHHKSFLDFLQDSSRSGEYHISKRHGQKRYLELIVDCVVRHLSMAIEHPDGHRECHSRPVFKSVFVNYPPWFVIPVEDWQEASRALLALQNKLFNTLKPRPCPVSCVMRDLLLHSVILRRIPCHMAVTWAPDSNMNGPIIEQNSALMTDTRQNNSENDLDRCLYVLISGLRQTNSVLVVDTVIIERISSLLVFNSAEIAARIQSVADGQKLIDLIDLVINDQSFLSQCGRDTARKAAILASEIFARVPLVPQSVFLNKPPQQCNWFAKSEAGSMEYMCQAAFITRLLDNNYILPLSFINQGDAFEFVDGEVDERNESLDKWLKRLKPNFVTKIRVMIEVAKTIRYIHSMDPVVKLSSMISLNDFAVCSNLRVKIKFRGLFACRMKEVLIYEQSDSYSHFTHESNISAFAKLFEEACLTQDLPEHLVKDVKQIIEQCHAEVPMMQPTMDDVVKEMESWNLT